MTHGPRFYADLHELEEDKRIGVIGRAILNGSGTVGVLVDDIPGKPERYIEKITARFPLIELLSRTPGPVANVVTLKFRARQS